MFQNEESTYEGPDEKELLTPLLLQTSCSYRVSVLLPLPSPVVIATTVKPVPYVKTYLVITLITKKYFYICIYAVVRLCIRHIFYGIILVLLVYLEGVI